MPFVVTQPFGDYAKGDQLSDDDGKSAIEAGQESFLVRVPAPPEPPKVASPAPAPNPPPSPQPAPAASAAN